jgi:hypothetical protein
MKSNFEPDLVSGTLSVVAPIFLVFTFTHKLLKDINLIEKYGVFRGARII